MSDSKRSSATWWDRAVVVALGGAACALSYDSLQQMAVSVHVRGALTYLFPLVIDGFIAYGVRALLVLQDAPLRARAYLWGLFGAATATSIWANGIHAVRLNEVATATQGLHLGDKVVAVLSTIAPLALAGATHLYILIDRGTDKARSAAKKATLDRQRPEGVVDAGSVDRTPEVSAAPVDERGHREALMASRVSEPVEQQKADAPHDTVAAKREDSIRSDRPVESHESGQPVLPGLTATNAGPTTGVAPGTETGLRLIKGAAAADTAHGPSTAAEDSPRPTPTRTAPRAGAPVRPGQRHNQDPDHTERLLQIAREAVRAEGRLTRKVVAEAIRGRDLTLSNDRLTELVHALKNQPGQSRSGHRPG
ncbi:DUF2637 domain-containing protein [Streptomyces sp. NPDC060243]|uniref:DUF2637 domain-containing protein n=1 Tax=Streptomyces sp. NPDC060243 TaxID=3347081 RepID=UPI00365DED98